MKAQSIALLITSLVIFIAINGSHAKQNRTLSQHLRSEYSNRNLDRKRPRALFLKTQPEISAPVLVAGFLCFIAAAISSAGGIGGGGLFIPILTIVSGLDLKTSSSLSAFMVTGGSIANVLCYGFIANPKFQGKSLIDYEIVLLSEPCMLLGVSVGVICNFFFPEWLVTLLFAVFLAWSTLKTCKNAIMCWKSESQELRRNGREKLENGTCAESDRDLKNCQEPLLGTPENCSQRFPLMKLGVLSLVWLSFYVVYLLRGNRYGQGILSIEPCGLGYWIISSIQIPLAVAFTHWILSQKKSPQLRSSHQEEEDLTAGGPSNKLVFPLMALLAGSLGGMFGIGGGMLISPLLLQVGVVPEVTAATCSFMVFFSSSMSACQYFLLGMEHTDLGLILAAVCFVASLLGLMVVQRAIHKYGRASLIVFSVSMVMALSIVLMTSFGAVNAWRDYIAGKYMGFKQPC